MSLRARINLLVTGLTLLFIALGLYLMLGENRRQIREEIEASNRVTAQLMTAVLFSSGLFSSGAVQQNVVHDFLSRLGRVRANDITLHDRLGGVVYVSPAPKYKAGRDAPLEAALAWIDQNRKNPGGKPRQGGQAVRLRGLGASARLASPARDFQPTKSHNFSGE